jgi:purine nucleosidase
VIIETDSGADDTWAVMLALASKDLEILGFTTVFGNVESTQAVENMLHVLELVGRQDVPVFLGSEGPIIPTLDSETGAPQSPSFPGKQVHGPKGLGSYNLPEESQMPRRNAVQWLAETVAQSKGTSDVVALVSRL